MFSLDTWLPCSHPCYISCYELRKKEQTIVVHRCSLSFSDFEALSFSNNQSKAVEIGETQVKMFFFDTLLTSRHRPQI